MATRIESPQPQNIEVSPKNPGVLTIIAGPTGSGKNSVQDALLNQYPQMRKVVTTTTRQPRENEVDGISYHFLSSDEFKAKVAEGGFLETALYAGNYYGTQPKDIEPVLEGQDLT